MLSKTPIEQGRGDAEVIARFRPDVPVGHNAGYGVVLRGRASLSGYPALRIGLFDPREQASWFFPAGCAPGLGDRAVLLQDEWATVIGCDLVAPSALSVAVVFRLGYSDLTDEVRVEYSPDGGAGVVSGALWDVPPPTLALPVSGGAAVPGVWGQGEVAFAYAGSSNAADETMIGSHRVPGGPVIRQDKRPPAWSAFVIDSAGADDLRRTPGDLTIDAIDGALAATATSVTEPRRVDSNTGRPLRAGAPGSTCATGGEPDCLTPSEVAPGNQSLYDSICAPNAGLQRP